MRIVTPLLCFILLCSLSVQADDKECLVGFCADVPIADVDGVALTINIAFPKTPARQPRPLVLLIHGGGFISGDKASKDAQIKKLTRLDVVAASVMYRLAPHYRFPTALEDIKLAIRYMKKNAARYHIDPQRIIVSGFSAGGYLAVMAGVTGNASGFSDYGLYSEYDSTVHAVTAQSAPVADYRLDKYRDSLTVKRLLPGDSDKFDEVLSSMSPQTHLDAEDPPFFLTHGDSDPIVPVEMTREFVKALENIAHEYEYIEVDGGTHSFSKSAPEEAKRSFQRYMAFIQRWMN